MSNYLLQENGDRIELEDGSGFLLLETGVVQIIITGAFDVPTPGGRVGRNTTAGEYDRPAPGGASTASPTASRFDGPSPGRTA